MDTNPDTEDLGFDVKLRGFAQEPTAKEEFERFWLGLHIPSFTAEEALVKTDSGLNHIPPAALWPNIVRTAWAWQLVRDKVGPCEWHSTYRSIAYNRTKGSPDTSLHVKFNAIDGHALEVSHEELHRVALDLRKAGAFTGGVGLYPWGIHIDTRGGNADW